MIEKQKINNKESITLWKAGRRIQERKGKQKANNKESVTPASQKGDQGTHGKTESQQQTVPQQNSPSTQHICT